LRRAPHGVSRTLLVEAFGAFGMRRRSGGSASHVVHVGKPVALVIRWAFNIGALVDPGLSSSYPQGARRRSDSFSTGGATMTQEWEPHGPFNACDVRLRDEHPSVVLRDLQSRRRPSAHIVTFANEKGGVGKSTFAFHCAVALAH